MSVTPELIFQFCLIAFFAFFFKKKK